MNMADVDTGLPSMFPTVKWQSKQEEVCVDIALQILVGKGWVEDEYVDAELIETLQRLRRNGHPWLRRRIQWTDDYLRNLVASNPGEALAYAWENEQELIYQRDHCPRWDCPYCGTEVALWDNVIKKGVTFYSLDKTGVFDKEVDACPGCGHDIRETIENGGPVQLQLPLPIHKLRALLVPPWLEGRAA